MNDLLLTVGIGSGVISDANQQGCSAFGLHRDDVVGQSIYRFMHPDDEFDAAATMSRVAQYGRDRYTQRLGTEASGWAHYDMYVLKIDADHVVVCGRDVTSLVESRRQVEELVRLGEMTDDLLVVSDSLGRARYVNGAAARLYGPSKDELIGSRLLDFIDDEEGMAAADSLVQEALANGGRSKKRVPVRDSNGNRVDLEISTVRDSETGHWYTVQRDISDVIKAERQLHKLNDELLERATRDDLTGLFNRSVVENQLERALATGESVALLMLDMDNFKLVNDSLGHAAGDQLLVHTAERLRGALHSDDVIARFGGDEFMVLIRDPEGCADPTSVAERARTALSQPFRLQGRVVHTSCSVGIVRAEPCRDSAADVMRFADIALYEAKANGRSRCALFDSTLRNEAHDRIAVQSALHVGVATEQFDVALQAIYRSDDLSVQGYEAFVRWHHPERGLLRPRDFIGAADSCGLLDKLTSMVLTKSLVVLGGWLQDDPNRTLSINVAASQLRDGQFGHRLIDVIDAHGVSPHQLVVELSDVEIAKVIDTGLSTLAGLDGLGIQVAIDNFGRGASSLGNLRELPLKRVKIDRHLVHSLISDPVSRSITASVVELAAQLGLTPLAECVETSAQLAALTELGCIEVQGHYLHEPELVTASFIPSGPARGATAEANADRPSASHSYSRGST